MMETTQVQRWQVTVAGAVQGVGFRPFVYRLAHDLGLTGWVNNTAQGVLIEVEGSEDQLSAFTRRLMDEKPVNSVIQDIATDVLPTAGFKAFEILASRGGAKTALILPDLATCPECMADISDPANRRYRYPFTNCTHCGPRFSIVQRLPYDRPHTTMSRFEMCPDCRHEYEDPLDRRFHAQPNACPVCGPQLALWDADGVVLADQDEALQLAGDAIRRGEIVAVKGLGGFHLVVDACNEAAVRRLRERKEREEKPLAVMYPGLETIRDICTLTPEAERILTSQACPIVLLDKRGGRSGVDGGCLAPSIAPGNPRLGVMLPYTPLHHLLLRDLGMPVVATSGNRTDEPICIDEREALTRLKHIADLFLIHDRPIARPVDDSVVQLVAGEMQILRRSRGYAPMPVPLDRELPPILAVGGHLKNTVALAVGSNGFISQHIGDLESEPAFDAFKEVVAQFENLYDSPPNQIACDLHPDYLSTGYARSKGVEVTPVQHHAAHVYSCMAEHHLSGPVLGISWDGTGYGTDGTVWGGEFIEVNDGEWSRVASLRTFPLPGGEAAVKEPRRSALGLLFELEGGQLLDTSHHRLRSQFSEQEWTMLTAALNRGFNSPRTSSMGRLFDAVSGLLGLRGRMSFEGQAAMELEWAIGDVHTEDAWPIPLPVEADPEGVLRINWEPMIRAMLEEHDAGTPVPLLAARFHNSLANLVVAMAVHCARETVVLTGGCFQNRTLTEQAIHRLRREGFRPVWHRVVPPNDAGIALGQLRAASHAIERS